MQNRVSCSAFFYCGGEIRKNKFDADEYRLPTLSSATESHSFKSVTIRKNKGVA